jgi:hypothetical protein
VSELPETARLLEIIAEKSELIREWLTEGNADPRWQRLATDHVAAIAEATIELRRRGDTLVRREDLRFVAQASRRQLLSDTEQSEVDAAWGRLGAALGGPL